MIVSCVHPKVLDEVGTDIEELLIKATGGIWHAGDRINLFDQAGSHCFTAIESGNEICFKGNALKFSASTLALYPYDSLAQFNPESNRITAFIPALRSAKQADGHQTAVGKVIDNFIEFTDISSLLKIEVSRNDVMSVEIISNDKSCHIAGKTEITVTDDISEISLNCHGSHSVCIQEDLEAIPQGEYYLEVLPCPLADGYSIRICLADGRISTIRNNESYIIGKDINDLGVIDGVLDFDAETGPMQIKSRSQYRNEENWTLYDTWTVDRLPGFCPVGNPETDEFGGWTGSFSFPATGWFHCRQKNGRWWMVDPLGNPFISTGVCCFRLYTGNRPFNEAFTEKYASDENRWALNEWEKLKEYGFNTIGSFSDEKKVSRYLHVPYVLTLSPMGDYLESIKEGCIAKYGAENWYEEGPFNFPMVFDEGFTAYCEKTAATVVAEGFSTDEYMLGIVTDNEFPVNTHFLETCLNWPDTGHVNYKKAHQWLKDNAITVKDATIDDNDFEWRRKFAAYCYETYLSKVSSSLKRYAPNHMYLGTKETGTQSSTALLNDYTFEVASKYVDVFSIDLYGTWCPKVEQLKEWSEKCGKPLLMAEWYVKGEDVALAYPDLYTNMDGVGWTVPTQKDRGCFYQNYVLKSIESGVVVGWHWFKCYDGHPETKLSGNGYYSPDNSNKGLMNIRMEPYEDCLDIMKELNDQIFPLCLYYK